MRSVILLPAFIFLAACDIENRPCENEDPVFTNNAPGTIAYNNELAKVLKDQKDDVTFYHAGYDEKAGREYMKWKHTLKQFALWYGWTLRVMIDWKTIEG